MLEGFAGIQYLVKMLWDLDLIEKGGFLGLTIVITDLLILSSPLVCLILFKNRGLFSYILILIFYLIFALLFGFLIVGFAVQIISPS